MLYWETAHTVPGQPHTAREFTGIWQAANKIVFSTTLQSVSSARTRIERNFDPGAVRQLKSATEHDMTVGGADLAGQAIKAGLVDELQLFLVPIVVGGGKRALPSGVRSDLELLDTRRFAERCCLPQVPPQARLITSRVLWHRGRTSPAARGHRPRHLALDLAFPVHRSGPASGTGAVDAMTGNAGRRPRPSGRVSPEAGLTGVLCCLMQCRMMLGGAPPRDAVRWGRDQRCPCMRCRVHPAGERCSQPPRRDPLEAVHRGRDGDRWRVSGQQVHVIVVASDLRQFRAEVAAYLPRRVRAGAGYVHIKDTAPVLRHEDRMRIVRRNDLPRWSSS